MTITGVTGYSTSNTFKIPNLALPLRAGPSSKHISGISLGDVKPKLRPPPPLTPAPKLKRTDSTNPLPLLEGMVKPILKPAIHKKVLKKALDTVHQEKSQNPRSKSNPTLDIFSQDSPEVIESPKQRKSKLTKRTPKKSEKVLVKTPIATRENSPYHYRDESLSPPPATQAKKSPEKSKSPVRRKLTANQATPKSRPSTSKPYRYPEYKSSSSQSSHEYIEDSDEESDRSFTSSSEHEDEVETEVFDDPDFQPSPKSYRYTLPTRSKHPIQLPARQLITPLRDSDGEIDYGSIDMKRRICDYDAPPEDWIGLLTFTKDRLLDRKMFKKFRAVKLEDLMKDERHREDAERKKKDFTMKKSTTSEKLLLAAEYSIQTGMQFESTHEFPDDKTTYSERLLYPLPMSSQDLWVARSYLDQNSQALQPRANFQLELFGKILNIITTLG